MLISIMLHISHQWISYTESTPWRSLTTTKIQRKHTFLLLKIFSPASRGTNISDITSNHKLKGKKLKRTSNFANKQVIDLHDSKCRPCQILGGHYPDKRRVDNKSYFSSLLPDSSSLTLKKVKTYLFTILIFPCYCLDLFISVLGFLLFWGWNWLNEGISLQQTFTMEYFLPLFLNLSLDRKIWNHIAKSVPEISYDINVTTE